MNRIKQKHLLAMAIGIALTPLASEAGNAYVFSAVINGFTTGSGGPSFKRAATMVLTNTITSTGTKQINPVDFGIYTGAITYSISTAGALNWFTNTRLASLVNSNTSLILSAKDLAYVFGSYGCISMIPDNQALGFYDANPNQFVANSSLTAQVYNVRSGQGIVMCSQDGGRTFTGTINLDGTSYHGGISPTVKYSATFSASLLGIKSF